ncbi:H-NS histone family protein [Xylophilus rhododendri]|jgi:DNA-binding protein H-NS|uniref:H-NS histone family protein n=1 Tax=Xylophilus rhododendri TaxID=2697032 RepID=A0A857J8U9_9BURK|nr:H-NS histone family protein [Xylophilus rhododendri]QHI99511.1 H-NS histone family protein [Xylophilus rhododendri]
MATFKELQAQKSALDAQIEAARNAELADAITLARTLVQEYGIDQHQLFGRSLSRRPLPIRKLGLVPAKYKDPASAKTWSGRGKPPRWIAGKDRTPFLIP